MSYDFLTEKQIIEAIELYMVKNDIDYHNKDIILKKDEEGNFGVIIKDKIYPSSLHMYVSDDRSLITLDEDRSKMKEDRTSLCGYRYSGDELMRVIKKYSPVSINISKKHLEDLPFQILYNYKSAIEIREYSYKEEVKQS